ncbi:hypothetical protein ACU10_01355 [Xanthomonas oryzae pv. oryzicola]|nr:hypothetical protein ACU13_01355 [Xanthomonas oryzae pv. oryzicola]AKN95652.1 hypothetical protein ACU10_01355 [Xanthomonas oryzae pv. oryzicola]AKO14609.1 hypothetical protein ACU12_01350 [Xanthomonas oryzae pv. oryzicola]
MQRWAGSEGVSLCRIKWRDPGRFRGGQSDEERALSFRFFDEQSQEAADDDYWDRTDLEFPTETHVMRLAQAWSIDPSSLVLLCY